MVTERVVYSWDEKDADMIKTISNHACEGAKCSVALVPMLSLVYFRSMELFVGCQMFPHLCDASGVFNTTVMTKS